MRCPYRYCTRSTALGSITVEETEEYGECYGRECPFYDAESVWKCLRAKAEYTGGVQGYDG